MEASTSPPGIPRAFDTLVVPARGAGGNLLIRVLREVRNFDPHSLGMGYLNRTLDLISFGRFGGFLFFFWVLLRQATRFHFSLFYTTNSKAVYLVARKLCNFKAIWILWKEQFEENENGSSYLSIPHERTICLRQVYFSTLGSSLKRRSRHRTYITSNRDNCLTYLQILQPNFWCVTLSLSRKK